MKSIELFNSYKPFTLVCVGDSTTSQDWCHPSWIDWLSFTFRQGDDDWMGSRNRKVINSGLDGNDIEYTLQHFDSLIEMFKPDIVILSLSFNDIERSYNVKEKATELINMIKSIGSDVVVWSTYDVPLPKYSPILKKSSEMYKELCKELGALFVDIYSEFQRYDLDKIFTYIRPLTWENEDWDLKPGDRDFMHCNEVGNQIIAEKLLMEVFNRNLSFTESWEGLGNTFPLDLTKYLK